MIGLKRSRPPLPLRTWIKKLRLRKQLRVSEDLKTPRDARRLLRLGDLLQLGKLRLELLP